LPQLKQLIWLMADSIEAVAAIYAAEAFFLKGNEKQ
jgi:hypothetical protein